ncbi:MAG TPA: nuclear transport factor 2 family protein [Xanthobacteraceae bacterium]|nr:nuclear transport factor 2 family protein [Xanthobacteraceae bacterium]
MHSLDPAEAYRRLVRKVYHGNFALCDQFVAADFVLHVPGVSDGTYRGPEGLRTVLQGAWAPFSSLTFRIVVGPIVQGNLLAARWLAVGVYAGGFPGAKVAPGTSVQFGGHDFFRFGDGLFVEYWGGADEGHVMNQLGMFS